MSWLKKTFRKAGKTLSRAKKGKFHLNPLKNGVHALSDPVGHSFYKLLPSKLQRKIRTNIDWGHLKKSHKLGLRHLLSPSSGYGTYSYTPVYSTGGYQYSGRSISEMM